MIDFAVQSGCPDTFGNIVKVGKNRLDTAFIPCCLVQTGVQGAVGYIHHEFCDEF